MPLTPHSWWATTSGSHHLTNGSIARGDEGSIARISAMRPRWHCCGFTLIELMVTVVVAGILAAVAYPAFTGYVQRARRADAIKALSALMQAQERYRSNRSSYASTFDALNANVSQLTTNYDISIDGIGNPASLATGYVMTATVKPGSPQAADTACAKMRVTLQAATVTYDALDIHGSASAAQAKCWAR